MASIVCFSDKLNSGQYLRCNDYLLVHKTDRQLLEKSGNWVSSTNQGTCRFIVIYAWQVSKVYRLGKTKDDKPRPLLIGLESETEKAEILSQSGKLRRYEQYNDVYIVADKTKYERDKHKKLVDELKHIQKFVDTHAFHKCMVMGSQLVHCP